MSNGEMPPKMRAMVLEAPKTSLVLRWRDIPVPWARQVLVKVISCGVCRTDQHIVDWELPAPRLPLIPGHEIIGKVVKTGSEVNMFREGDYVGIPWLAHTCGECRFCRNGQENLCDKARFTGFSTDGGFAEYTVAYADFCLPLWGNLIQPAASPLLCAGLIGFRSYKMLPAAAHNIGFYGFGAAAHVLIQVAIARGQQVYAFTRDDDIAAQQFASKAGAVWVGNSTREPPVKLDGAILFAPAGNLVPKALTDVEKGGVVICAGIYMSHIPQFPYDFLWGERSLRSVANLTRKDGWAFLEVAQSMAISTETTLFPLEKANDALNSLRTGTLTGAAVLVMDNHQFSS